MNLTSKLIDHRLYSYKEYITPDTGIIRLSKGAYVDVLSARHTRAAVCSRRQQCAAGSSSECAVPFAICLPRLFRWRATATIIALSFPMIKYKILKYKIWSGSDFCLSSMKLVSPTTSQVCTSVDWLCTQQCGNSPPSCDKILERPDSSTRTALLVYF